MIVFSVKNQNFKKRWNVDTVQRLTTRERSKAVSIIIKTLLITRSYTLVVLPLYVQLYFCVSVMKSFQCHEDVTKNVQKKQKKI